MKSRLAVFVIPAALTQSFLEQRKKGIFFYKSINREVLPIFRTIVLQRRELAGNLWKSQDLHEHWAPCRCTFQNRPQQGSSRDFHEARICPRSGVISVQRSHSRP